MKQTLIYLLASLLIVGLLVALGFTGCDDYRAHHSEKILQDSLKKYQVSVSDTHYVTRWTGKDTADIIKWYVTRQPAAKHYPCPKIDTTRPGVMILYRDTCYKDPDTELKTTLDTIDRRDLYMMYTIQTWGNTLASFAVNKYKVKVSDMIINHPLHDTIPVKSYRGSLWLTGSAGLATANHFKPETAEGSLEYMAKKGWMIGGGYLYNWQISQGFVTVKTGIRILK